LVFGLVSENHALRVSILLPQPPEMKVEPPKRSKKEREKVEQAKKVRRKPLPRSAHNPPPLSRTGSIQSLLTAGECVCVYEYVVRMNMWWLYLNL